MRNILYTYIYIEILENTGTMHYSVGIINWFICLIYCMILFIMTSVNDFIILVRLTCVTTPCVLVGLSGLNTRV
jgi:hypothetical protein